MLLALIPLVAIIGWHNTSLASRPLAYISLALSLATRVAMASLWFDIPDFGLGGRVGSLNRMWLQGYAVFILQITVGLAQRANPGWPVALV